MFSKSSATDLLYAGKGSHMCVKADFYKNQKKEFMILHLIYKPMWQTLIFLYLAAGIYFHITVVDAHLNYEVVNPSHICRHKFTHLLQMNLENMMAKGDNDS